LALRRLHYPSPLILRASRAQRSTKRSGVMRCRPGIVTRSICHV
jgi:hypothetical protein